MASMLSPAHMQTNHALQQRLAACTCDLDFEKQDYAFLAKSILSDLDEAQNHLTSFTRYTKQCLAPRSLARRPS